MNSCARCMMSRRLLPQSIRATTDRTQSGEPQLRTCCAVALLFLFLSQLEFLTCALGGKARFASSTLLTSQRDQLRQHGFGVGQFDILLQHMKVRQSWKRQG